MELGVFQSVFCSVMEARAEERGWSDGLLLSLERAAEERARVLGEAASSSIETSLGCDDSLWSAAGELD